MLCITFGILGITCLPTKIFIHEQKITIASSRIQRKGLKSQEVQETVYKVITIKNSCKSCYKNTMVDSLKDSKSSKMNSQMAGNGGTAEGGNGNENKRDSKEIVFVGYYSCTEKHALNKEECNQWGGYSVNTKCQEGELTDDPYGRSANINCRCLHVRNTNGL
jgi:hypothetical protein